MKDEEEGVMGCGMRVEEDDRSTYPTHVEVMHGVEVFGQD